MKNTSLPFYNEVLKEGERIGEKRGEQRGEKIGEKRGRIIQFIEMHQEFNVSDSEIIDGLIDEFKLTPEEAQEKFKKYKRVMNLDNLIQNEPNFIPESIMKRLNLQPGDRVKVKINKDGTLRLEKEERISPEESLKAIHKSIQKKGGFESVGLMNEDDVAQYVREIRHEKSKAD